jgi:protein TonB
MLLIGGALAWAVSRPLPLPEHQVVLSFAAPAVEQPDKAEPEPPKPQPVVRNQPLPKPSIKPTPRMPAPVEQPQVSEPEPVPVQQTTAPLPFSAPISPPRTQPAPPPLKVPEVDPTPAYNAKLAAAAQAAFSMPSVAINLGFKGRAQVQFNLRDAVVSRIQLAKSSGLGAVDRAALNAVQSAKYPLPPAPLQGKDIAFSIWVEAY